MRTSEMGSIDQIDDRTFRVNFTVDGVVKLRDRVKDKLKEYMGDYTDDTLVEYVIVLLRNGRRKDESRNELNVFLGDDSDSFIAWLWDHLASNLEDYIQPQNEVSKQKSHSNQSGRNDSHHLDSEPERRNHLDSEPERRKSNLESRSRRNKEWKGLAKDAAEPPPLRSSDIEDMHLHAKGHHKINHSRMSPSLSAAQRKRSRPDEQASAKRETSQIKINAPRRLLQFAVRDAVATSVPTNSSAEPSLKRLRSVVSTASGESTIVDRPRRNQSVARVPNPMATVIKAVAEAAEDVTKLRSPGSVFDRLGRGMDVSERRGQFASFGEAAIEDSEYEHVNPIHEKLRSAYIQQNDQIGKYIGNRSILETETMLPSDSISHNEGYDDINAFDHRVTDASQIGTSSGNKVEHSAMSQYSLAKNANEVRLGATPNASHKIVNISVNVNAWKPAHYQETREFAEVDGLKSVQEREDRTSKSCVRVMENSSSIAVSNGSAKAADSQKESQKIHLSAAGHYASGRPLEDADSRTLFVSNVHFAATKDSLSRHFNKYGEVLKVIIVTDATTGQPTGSAYVEFMRKEAANNALSLDGTSFMSRILKVVRRSAAQQEAASTMTWPRIARGATFSTSGFPRPFARGFPGAFRPRPPIKVGARSLQWKRDSQVSSSEISASLPGNPVPSSTARSLTYVRTESKPVANSNTN